MTSSLSLSDRELKLLTGVRIVMGKGRLFIGGMGWGSEAGFRLLRWSEDNSLGMSIRQWKAWWGLHSSLTGVLFFKVMILCDYVTLLHFISWKWISFSPPHPVDYLFSTGRTVFSLLSITLEIFHTHICLLDWYKWQIYAETVQLFLVNMIQFLFYFRQKSRWINYNRSF